jgi:endoglucanase
MDRLRRVAGVTLRLGVLLLAVSPMFQGVRGASGHPGVSDRLDGVSVSGTESQCVDGPALPPGHQTLAAALRTWPIDAVRVPLNEDCWLGINRVQTGGEDYRSAIGDYVRGLERDYVVILELHWSAPGSVRATAQQPMPDADDSIAFWASVASRFRGDRWVLFEPFNEPAPPSWECWRDGCLLEATFVRQNYRRPVRSAWHAAGMAALVAAIRGAGARQPILLDGIGGGNDLSGWARYVPVDPDLVAAWHLYPGYPCNASDCWRSMVVALGRRRVLATEVGEADDRCSAHFVQRLVPWLEDHGIGYLAWSFNPWGTCSYGVIADDRGTPSPGYGQWMFDHLSAEARAGRI